MWNKFLSTNTSGMKVLRTIFQGIVGVIIANLDAIVGLQAWIPSEYKAITVAIIMAILSPIMAEIGKHITDPESTIVEPLEDEPCIGAPIEDVVVEDIKTEE